MIDENLKSLLTNMFHVIQSLPITQEDTPKSKAAKSYASMNVQDSILEASNEESSLPSSQQDSYLAKLSSNSNSADFSSAQAPQSMR